MENQHLKHLMQNKLGFSASKQPPQASHNNTPLQGGDSDYNDHQYTPPPVVKNDLRQQLEA